MAEVLIREARPEDERELLAMMRKLAEQEPGASSFNEAAARAAFHQLLALPAFGVVWLLCDSSRPVGYFVLTIGFSFEFHGHDAFIDELYVAPDYRRRGLGRRAVEFLEKEARTRGVNALHLEVDRGNDPAAELYRRAGYRGHGRSLMTKWIK